MVEGYGASTCTARATAKWNARVTDDTSRSEVAKAQEALGNGADDARWPPGTSAVDALIAERDRLAAEVGMWNNLVRHVSENGPTSKASASGKLPSGEYAMVHPHRLTDLEVAEEERDLLAAEVDYRREEYAATIKAAQVMRDELNTLRSELAALKARKVKLPPVHGVGPYGKELSKTEVVLALLAAGIEVEQ
jgi:hypothetical protein